MGEWSSGAAARRRSATRRPAQRLHEASIEFEVPFHDVDALGVVWHGHYYKYLELARTRLLRARGLDAGDLVGPRYRFVAIESACRHASPLRYGDRVRVTAWLRDVEHRIFVAYEVTNLTTGRRAARAHTILATTDRGGNLLLRTPRAIRERLGADLPGASAEERPRREACPLVTRIHLDPPAPPAWVEEVLGAELEERPSIRREGLLVSLDESPDASFLRLTLPSAAGLDDASFRDAVRHAYATLGALLRERGELSWRVWNYVPAIRRRASGAASRYEVFNEGRRAGCEECGGLELPGDRFAAASAVGHRGQDLVVHVLAGRAPAIPIENPRQIPAYRYSRRHGRVAPCFSRASLLEKVPTAWHGRRNVLVAGTASIVGEDSRHPGDLDAQLRETLVNLAWLSAAVAGERPPADGDLDERARRALARYGDLRAYVVRIEDADAVLSGLRRAFPALRRFELASADLCRPELLVEVEGSLSLEASDRPWTSR
jgi:YbgC/YbaW family acyl-CoA thioester hydrolase